MTDEKKIVDFLHKQAAVAPTGRPAASISKILSSFEIYKFLLEQANMRAPENDMAGVLTKLARELAKEAYELEDWDEQVNAKYIEDAIKHYPEGATCGWCGEANDFADDCGWFMCNPLAHERHATGERWGFGEEPKDFRYTCRACYFGEIGKKHTAYYGESDR